MHEPIINPVSFAEAKSLLGEKFSTILNYFLEDSEQYIASIVAGFAQGDTDIIASSAHALKSSAKQMGADRLSALSRQLELGAKEKGKPLSTLSPIVADLENTLAETKAAYAKLS